MAASSPKNVGSYGQIRVLVDRVSQNAGANTSRVRVRGQMSLRQGSNANNQNGVHMKTTCSPGGSTTESNPFSVGTSWVTVIDNTYTVSHAADGNRTVTGTFELGSTGTTSFGSGGSVSLSLKLPRIPRPPSKPSRPTISNVTATSFRGVLASAPAANGASIIEYRWEIENLDTPSTATHVTSGRTWSTGGRAPNTRYRLRIQARNSAGWGSYSDWSATIRTKPNAPAAPSGGSIAYIDLRTLHVSWSNNPSSTAPYGSVLVESWNTIEDTWRRAATLGPTATSYTDINRSLNRQYQYRIIARNASGDSAAHWLGRIYTQPNAPSAPVASKRPGGDILLTWTNLASYAISRYEIWDSPSGGTPVKIGEVAGTSFTHMSPDPTKTHSYTVRAVRLADETNSQPTLYSNHSPASNTVQLLAPPLAPSLVGPNGVTDRDEPVRLEFEHNSVDTTDQTAGEVRWRPTGGTWTTVSTGTDPFYVLPAPGTSGAFEWQARTRGEHANWSPWSATWSFSTVSRPEVVIQAPEATLEESQVEVVWGYQNADGPGQSRWEAHLLDASGDVLAAGSNSGTATRHRFPTILEDGTEYTVRVRARAGSGLWSEWDTSTFVTDFPLPYPVEVLPEWDRETGSVSITFQVDDSDATEQAPDSVDVQRDDGDGDGWITIAAGLDPETSIVDHTPRLAEIRYRTISRTTLPTARTGPETVTEPPRGLWPVFLNGGPDLGDVVAIYDNTKLAFGRGRAKTRRIWAGRDWPTTKWGQARSKAVALTATISPESPGATVADVEALEDMPSVVCVRDILGHKIFVTIDDVDSDVERDGRWNISIPMTREHYIEGVR